jgi:hypothetical protein
MSLRAIMNTRDSSSKGIRKLVQIVLHPTVAVVHEWMKMHSGSYRGSLPASYAIDKEPMLMGMSRLLRNRDL